MRWTMRFFYFALRMRCILGHCLWIRRSRKVMERFIQLGILRRYSLECSLGFLRLELGLQILRQFRKESLMDFKHCKWSNEFQVSLKTSYKQTATKSKVKSASKTSYLSTQKGIKMFSIKSIYHSTRARPQQLSVHLAQVKAPLSNSLNDSTTQNMEASSSMTSTSEPSTSSITEAR